MYVEYHFFKIKRIIFLCFICRLGRVQQLKDLSIINFSPVGIRCSEAALTESRNLDMRANELEIQEKAFFEDSYAMIGYINISQFKPHFDSLWNENNTALCDVIGIGETWLKPNENVSNLLPQNYNNHFLNDNNGKGLAVFYKGSEFIFQSEDFYMFPGCFSMLKLDVKGIRIIFVYISSKISFHMYREQLQKLIGSEIMPKVVIGDVNWHYGKPHQMKSHMLSNGFQQLIKYPTHRLGNILDHIFVNQSLLEFQGKIEVHQKPCFFTDHDFLFLNIKQRKAHLTSSDTIGDFKETLTKPANIDSGLE